METVHLDHECPLEAAPTESSYTWCAVMCSHCTPCDGCCVRAENELEE